MVDYKKYIQVLQILDKNYVEKMEQGFDNIELASAICELFDNKGYSTEPLNIFPKHPEWELQSQGSQGTPCTQCIGINV